MAERNERNKNSPQMITLYVLIAVQIAVVSFGYGLLNQQVRFNREIIQTYQTNQTVIMNKLDDLNSRMIKLEITIQTYKKEEKPPG